MNGGSDADNLSQSIQKSINYVTTRGDILTPDVRKATERQTVRELRTEAGHRFESDGFDMDTCEDAAHTVESAGYRELFWYTSPDVVDDIREWYDDRSTADNVDEAGLNQMVIVANHPVVQAFDDVFDRDVMFLIGDGSIITHPLSSSHVHVLGPDGVAVVRL